MAQESRLSLVVDSRQAKPSVEEVAKVMRLLGDAQGAWNLYIRIWRPGQPHRHTWSAFYTRALKAVQ